ncbi:MAG: hypothetical protein ACLP1X_07075 [Polyangiaceae bacterium]
MIAPARIATASATSETLTVEWAGLPEGVPSVEEFAVSRVQSLRRLVALCRDTCVDSSPLTPLTPLTPSTPVGLATIAAALKGKRATIAYDASGPTGDYSASEPAKKAAQKKNWGSDNAAPRQVWTPSGVLDRWAAEGPLRHEPTNLPIDDWTDGGPVYGTRFYWLGAPDAGKTAVILQIGDVYARRGVCMGILAVDEEPGDMLTRQLQRRGFTRRECEKRDPARLRAMREAVGDLPMRFYGDDYTIESAAHDLATFANGRRAALFFDSVQTITCDAVSEDDDVTERALVTANVRAIRSVATEHRMIVMATSEMNRAAYRSIEAIDQSKRAGDMAAGKESGAIEYSARVIVSLRAVEGMPDLIEATVVKNKHGPSRETFYLEIDRAKMMLTAVDAPSAMVRDEQKNARALKQNAANAARLAVFLAEHQGVTTNELYAGLRARYGAFGESSANVALSTLGEAVRYEPLPNRAKGHHLDGRKVRRDVLDLITESSERKSVLKARWPDSSGAR